jgi:hypothetical protein
MGGSASSCPASVQGDGFADAIETQLTAYIQSLNQYLPSEGTPSYITQVQVDKLYDELKTDATTIQQQLSTFSTQLPLPTVPPVHLDDAAISGRDLTMLAGVEGSDLLTPACGAEGSVPWLCVVDTDKTPGATRCTLGKDLSFVKAGMLDSVLATSFSPIVQNGKCMVKSSNISGNVTIDQFTCIATDTKTTQKHDLQTCLWTLDEKGALQLDLNDCSALS